MAPVAPVQPMPIRKPKMMPRMPEALPPQMGPRSKGLPSLNYGTLDRPRMMMSKGRDADIVDFLNANPEQIIFGIDSQLDKLDLELEQAQMNNDRDAIDMIGDEMNDLLFERIKLSNISGDQQRADDFISALDDNLDMARKRMIDESRSRASRMGPRSLTPEQQTRLMQLKILRGEKPNASTLREMRSEAKDQRNLDMQMQQRDALDEFLQELEKKNLIAPHKNPFQ